MSTNIDGCLVSGFWQWIPGKSVGPFVFGERADPYIRDYALRKRKPDCSIADWETYEFPGFESWVIVQEGRILDVYCADEVEYRGVDLIGMTDAEIAERLGEGGEKDFGTGLGYAVEYDELGLRLFFVDQVVTAASCGLIAPSE